MSELSVEGLEEAGSNGCCFLPFPQSVVGSLISSDVYSALELSPSWEWLGGELEEVSALCRDSLPEGSCQHHREVASLAGVTLSSGRWTDCCFFPFHAVCPPGPGCSKRPPGARENREDL